MVLQERIGRALQVLESLPPSRLLSEQSIDAGLILGTTPLHVLERVVGGFHGVRELLHAGDVLGTVLEALQVKGGRAQHTTGVYPAEGSSSHQMGAS
eukprot:9809859-Alexandrium_andersonii.AAC.1